MHTTGSSAQASPMAHPQSRSLADLALELGERVPCAGNLPLDMADPQSSWFIQEGAVDLFLTELHDGVEQSAPQHLMRTDAGRLLLGVEPQVEGTTLGLIAKGLPGTVLRRIPAASLGAVRNEELAEQVDAWLADVSAVLSRDVVDRPRPDLLVEPGKTLAAQAGTLSARRGVAWVSELPPGSASFMGLLDVGQDLPERDSGYGAIPLTPSLWLTVTDKVAVSAQSSEALADKGLLLAALASFHAMGFSLERLNRRLAVVDQANLDWARATSRRVDEDSARRGLFNLYDLPVDGTEGEGDSPLKEALRIIGRHQGIEFKWPARATASDATRVLAEVLAASGVRARRVRLDSEDRWWTGDSGPMLAFRAVDGQPVALLPRSFGRYQQVDPNQKRKTRVTASVSESLRTEAWVFYTPLTSGSAAPRDLLRIARNGVSADLARLVASGLAGGLVMLLPAIAVGIVADEMIPSGETDLLYPMTAALAAFAVLGALLHVFRGTSLMRLDGRAVSRMEAAFWDRMLRLSPAFLHRYAAGDLAMRGMTFQNLRDAVHGLVGNSVLSVAFLSPALLVTVFYDAVLGSVTVAFGLLSLAVAVAVGMWQIAPHGRVIRTVQRLSGRLFQLINGITQLRVAGAEGSAFAAWARDYREQKHAELRVGTFEQHLRAFGEALPFLAGAVLILAATFTDREGFSVGDFLVVFTLLLLFESAVTSLSSSFSAVAASVPAFNQLQPLLSESPEVDVDGESVDHLGGEVAFDHVSFRYDPDGPLLLDDVSMRADPGEFVAITGESGSGKSTLFKLALGLHQPSSGAVYYDGRDLKHLNIKQLRRKVGVVPQDVQLHPEDVWDNIVGDYEDATSAEVWNAAQIAAVDRVISAMPMSMMTNVGARASVMSGGESQRIVVAHALIRNPRILFLDEATNWLDNESQAEVMNNLAGLTATRIVIAHRLSTLRQADRIYVMSAGRVVQQGSFAELEATEGPFQDLVRRQSA